MVAAVEAHGAVTRFFSAAGPRDRALDRGAGQGARTVHRSATRRSTCGRPIGNDLQKIVNELEKVEIFIKEKKTITFEDVKTVVGDFREYTSFDLAAAVGAKNREKALLILTRLLQEGEAPVGLLGSIAWNFRRLLQAKSMEAVGTPA